MPSDKGTSDGPIIDRLSEIGIIPVVELPTAEDAVPLLEALLEAGLPAAEITLRTAAGLEAVALLREAYPTAAVGAGTVRWTEDVERVVAAGAQFVVSPAINAELIAACATAGVPSIPGACTPTDVDTAVRAGASVVKFFPAAAMGGVPFLQALGGPFRDVRFIPTGGINAGNLAEYLRLPQVLACGGSWMVHPALIRNRAFAEITALAREAVAIVEEVRNAVAA